MFTSQMMKEVHRIAANLEGDYSARLVLAFREVLKADEIVLALHIFYRIYDFHDYKIRMF